MIRQTQWIVLVLGLIAGSASQVFAQDTPARTSITGFLTYELAKPMNQVLKAHPNLSPRTSVTWTTGVPTTNYSAQITAPIDGINYRANLGVQFYQTKLGAIVIVWPRSLFRSFDQWKLASGGLFAQLRATYAESLVQDMWISDERRTMIEFKDTAGNRIVMLAADRSISLIYLWSAFDVATGRVPPAKVAY